MAEVEERVDAALEVLRADGGRVTTARRAIVAATLGGEDHHVTADEVAARVQAEHPDVALSTVYRTLEAMEERGIVARIDLGHGRAVFHPVDQAHHHVVCAACGRAESLAPAAVASLAAELDARLGFALAPDHLTLTGVCRRCR